RRLKKAPRTSGGRMKIGFVGLGKLGLPCAVAIALKGHDVLCYDVAPTLMNKTLRPYRETGPDGWEPFNAYLERSTIRFGSMEEVIEHSEIVFVAVQTPHDARYEGTTRLKEQPADFDYQYLTHAIREIASRVKHDTVVSLISTVLPGTVRRYVRPIKGPKIRLCYNPFFVAMGTTMRDFLDPEFILLGVDDEDAAAKMGSF